MIAAIKLKLKLQVECINYWENQLKACRGQIDKSEVKLEIISSYRISRCTSMQNYSLLALKMTELWLFSIFDLGGRGQRDVRDQNWGQI